MCRIFLVYHFKFLNYSIMRIFYIRSMIITNYIIVSQLESLENLINTSIYKYNIQ